jgi:hypothetical protein
MNPNTNKPQEIDAIELDKFHLLVDSVLEKLDPSKKVAEVVTEVLEPASNLITNDGANGLLELAIIGESTGPMMILNFNIEQNKYVKVFSNAAVAADNVKLNPTTIRQRCKDNKIIDGIQWSYITAEEYTALKG